MGIQFILLVGLGGAIGSVFRASLSFFLSPQTQLATLLVNLIGAFLIGFFTKWSSSFGSGDLFRAFWIIGICGGFTTFSTFGMDLVHLFEKGSLAWGISYLFANVMGTLAFIWIGIKVANITLS